MLSIKWIASATAILLLVGCADTAEVSESTKSADSTASDSETADSRPPVTESFTDFGTSDAAPDTESLPATETEPEPTSDYVALPDGLPPQLVSGYKQVCDSAATGDFNGLFSLAGISQQIAGQVAESDSEAANAFFKQAAVALRAGREKYDDELPGSFVGPILYNEACAFAKEGNLESAEASLAEAIECGFSDFDLLKNDADLESIRSAPGFEDKLTEWEVAAKEKSAKRIKDELAANESFPFDFTLNDIDGNEQSLAAYKGKVVIVDIWGTWCPPCREEIPSFVKLQETLGDKGFQMLGLNYEHADEEANIATVSKFMKETGINYPCILGDDVTRSQVPNFEGFPTTLFIDKAGKVRLKAVGLHEYSYLEGIVTELLAEEAPAEDAAG